MDFLKELLLLSESDNKKTKKNKKDKTADKYPSYVAGNLFFNNTCSGKLSGDKQPK